MATRRLQCGTIPDCWIEPGQPYCLLRGDGWCKVRCAAHAGSPVPELIEAPQEPRPRQVALLVTTGEAPELEPHAIVTTPMHALRTLVPTLPWPPRRVVDVKQRAAGEAGTDD